MGVTLYPKSWQGAPFYPETKAAILLLINASGRRYCLSTVDVDVQEMNTGQLLRFVGGIVSDPVHREAIDVKSRQSAPQSMQFSVMSEYFPLKDLRKAGILLQDIDVWVYWTVLGRDYSMPRARLLLEGKLQSPTFNETGRTVNFLVQDNRLEGERMFPPVVATQDRIANLAEDQAGKAYPIIIGTVKKAPVLDISGGTFDDFLVMHDPFSEFSGGVVTAVYDGDATGPPTINAQGSDTDLQGSTYWQVDLVVGASGRDVTADVVGHSPSAPADVIQYLLNFFTNRSSVFSPGFLKEIILKLSAIEMAFIINSRPARGGAISFIRNRVLGQLPVALMPIADKYRFKVVDWQREPSKIMSYQDGSLLDLTSGPYETKLSEVFNEFVFRYGRSGLRGGSTGVVVKNANNNRLCYLSQRRYGNRVMGDIDLGDIANVDGANIIADWFVDTYSKMRVHCSYRCSLQVENLELLETMRVDDRYQQWNTKFLTTGVSRSTGKSQGVDLISTGDYYEVYRKEDSVTVYDNSRPEPTAPIDVWGDWWYFRGTWQLADGLEHAAVDDFKIESDVATWYIGIEPDWSGIVTTYPIYKEDDYRLKLHNFGGGPGLDRYMEGWVRINQGGASALARKGDLQTPGERTLLAVTWEHTTKTVYVKFIDSTGTYVAQGSNPRVAPTMDNANPLRLAWQALMATTYFKGKIFFFSWYKGQNLIAQADDVYNKIITPQSLGPTCQLNFERAVAATYLAEVGTGPNAPYVWDVLGTPILNGP